MIKEQDIFEMVAAEIKRQKISKLELSRRMNIHSTSIHGMYERKRIPFNRLVQLSEILNYNFFQAIANQIEIPNPAPITGSKEPVDDYKNTIQNLQTKVSLLEEMYTKAFQSISGKTGDNT